MHKRMKFLASLLLVFVACSAFAQPGGGRGYGDRGRGEPGRYVHRDYRDYGRPMPPPERRMTWEDRQRLREQVRGGNMTREEARERWREQRELRDQGGYGPGRSPEERQRLRRDVQDWNRDFERR